MSEILNADEVDNIQRQHALSGELQQLCRSHERLREWVVALARIIMVEVVHKVGEGKYEGYYDTISRTEAKEAGDLLVQLADWERHEDGRFYKPPEEEGE